MARPTRKGQKVIVRGDNNLVFIVDNFLGAAGKSIHDNILSALKEKDGSSADEILVSWNVPGEKFQGSAMAKDCEVI